jgi:hypothetical protein
MTRRADSRPRSRLLARLAAAAALGLLVGSLGVPVGASAADFTITQAEQAMVAHLNADRTAAGLVPVRVDSRLMAIARARSVDMATKHYFSHEQPDGRFYYDILEAKNITTYGSGEIIAYNNLKPPYDSLELATANANSQWMNSPLHRAIVMSTSMNYVGVGIAIDASSGRKLFTAIYIKGPDRTGARSTTQAPIVGASVLAGTRRVSVSWTGADVKLQVLTSGFNSWKVQRRTDGGAWTTVWASTTKASMTVDLAGGHTYEFRTAARDNAGNWGAWSTVGTAFGRVLGSGSRR